MQIDPSPIRQIICDALRDIHYIAMISWLFVNYLDLFSLFLRPHRVSDVEESSKQGTVIVWTSFGDLGQEQLVFGLHHHTHFSQYRQDSLSPRSRLRLTKKVLIAPGAKPVASTATTALFVAASFIVCKAASCKAVWIKSVFNRIIKR